MVAHSLKADGFDASEDGTGRGTPLIAFQSNAGSQGGDVHENVCPTLRVQKAGGGGMPAIAFAQNQRDEVREVREVPVAGALAAEPGMKQQSYIANGWAVRRLMPIECERLQGFPYGYTDVPYRNKQAADGPRYKALGNSMAVNVMRWLGRRIELVNNLSANTHNN